MNTVDGHQQNTANLTRRYWPPSPQSVSYTSFGCVLPISTYMHVRYTVHSCICWKLLGGHNSRSRGMLGCAVTDGLVRFETGKYDSTVTEPTMR